MVNQPRLWNSAWERIDASNRGEVQSVNRKLGEIKSTISPDDEDGSGLSWRKYPYARFCALAAMAWVIFTVLNGLWFGHFKTPLVKFDSTITGSIGDSFGPVSAIMAALAAVGAWKAVSLQSRELEESKKALDETKKSEIIRQIEITFFNLFGQIRAIIDGLSFGAGNGLVGQKAFEKLLELQSSQLETQAVHNLMTAEAAYLEFFNKFGDQLSSLFRLLYHMMVLLDGLHEAQKIFYLKLIYSQFSNTQLLLIAANHAFHPKGRNCLRYTKDLRLLHNISFSSHKALEALFKEVFGDGYFESD